MIIGSRFYGDENTTVMCIQHDCYGFIIGEMVRRAIQTYKKAAILLNLHTEIGERLTQQFDHRIVQETHDLIAAWFRFKKYPYYPLFHEEIDISECRNQWYKFALQEIDELLYDPHFTRAVVLSIVGANNKIGYENEDYTVKYLKERYFEMFKKTFPK